MATTLQEILERYEHEHASTHAVIAAMPDAHASFRPHERSRSWAQLAWHVATTPLYYVSEVFKLRTRSGWDLDSARPPTTTAGLVQALDDIYAEVVFGTTSSSAPGRAARSTASPRPCSS
jgi:uncharacterized damage-inducible protein DinB